MESDDRVDILAVRGTTEFDGIRVCVQVKSRRQVVGMSVVRKLQGGDADLHGGSRPAGVVWRVCPGCGAGSQVDALQ